MKTPGSKTILRKLAGLFRRIYDITAKSDRIEADDVTETVNVKNDDSEIDQFFSYLYFKDYIHANYLDGTTGFFIFKLYQLREGQPVAASVEKFLAARPDIRYCMQGGIYLKMLEYPTYLLIGSMQDAKTFAVDAPELVNRCREENIHVIGGFSRCFQDCFDNNEYCISITKYPGSVDDAASYGEVSLQRYVPECVDNND